MSEDNNGKLSDVVKKIFNSGLSGVGLINEELLKGVPKELIGQVLQNAKSTKDDFMKAVSDGVTDYLGKVNFQKEFDRLIEDYDINMNVQFKITRKKHKEENEEEYEEEDDEEMESLDDE